MARSCRRADSEALLTNPKIIKSFIRAVRISPPSTPFGVMPQPVYCTKIASRLCRTYTDRHGLKDLGRVLNIDLSKQQQSSDWGAQALTRRNWPTRRRRLHLHGLRERWIPCSRGEGAWSWRKPVSSFCRRGRSSICRAGIRGHFRPFLRSRPFEAPSRSAQRDPAKASPDLSGAGPVRLKKTRQIRI